MFNPMRHLNLTASTTDDHWTIDAALELPGATYRVTVTHRVRRAIIDGIIWWALGRALDHWVSRIQAIAATRPVDPDAYHKAESLLHYVTHTADYGEAGDARAGAIMRTVRDTIPELAPLADLVPAGSHLYALTDRLAKVLAERIELSYGDALHGVREEYNEEGMAA